MFEGWRSVGGDEEEGFQRFFVEIRGLRLDHFNRHNPKGPHVYFRVILFLLYDFGGHPIRCSDHRRSFGLLIRQFGTESEVGFGKKVSLKYCENHDSQPKRIILTNFDISAGVEEYVVALNIAMNNILAMQMG